MLMVETRALRPALFSKWQSFKYNVLDPGELYVPISSASVAFSGAAVTSVASVSPLTPASNSYVSLTQVISIYRGPFTRTTEEN